MRRDVDKIVAALTLEEKASLCSGRDFWNTKAVERLGILSWMMTDGPHGLRKQRASADALGINDSVPATCFPAGSSLASSWNRELLEELGQALGDEAKAERISVVLGPAVNIKRSPLCGRNFEYLSEDPYLAGEMAKHYIVGLQSRGVGASIKHFAANNQEKNRLLVDTIVDERTMREIYLPAFETAVKEAQPWTVMASYNRINGAYNTENHWLLTEVLKQEWGHTGIVVSDWGAVDDRVEGLKAGNELEMPGVGGETDKEIVLAVRSGALAETILDGAVRRLLDVTFRALDNMDLSATCDAAAHHELARRAAAECMVLLKNDGGILPLTGKKSVAFIGQFAKKPRFQGGGSSHINPTRLDDAVEQARALLGASCSIEYAAGYELSGKSQAPSSPEAKALVAEAAALAARCEAAVLFIGLTEDIESEGFDRSDMRLPAAHEALLAAVASVQPNLVVVLSNGSPVEMPWIDAVPAVLESYLGGQAWGGAVVDLLFGRENPSGKLAETFPRRLEDNPSYLNFPGAGKRVEYREGIHVGYRYYDAAKVEPLFPFGHGLSYARFEYSALSLDKTAMRDTETLEIRVDVANSGKVAGAEVVQLYVGDLEASVVRPVRELKGFRKVFLKPGERKTVSFSLGKRAFAFWSTELGDWLAESGTFEVSVGSSSRDIRSRARVELRSSDRVPRKWDMNSCLSDIMEEEGAKDFVEAMESRYSAATGQAASGSPESAMFEAMLKEMPLRTMVGMFGAASRDETRKLLDKLNEAEASGKGR